MDSLPHIPILSVLSGTVRPGDQLGRCAGHPTVNLSVIPSAVSGLTRGVYASFITLPDGSNYRAATNIGVRPTVTENGEFRIESHILHFFGDLYGRQLTLSLCRFLRSEKEFPDFASLQQEIARNIEETDLYFDKLGIPFVF